MAAAAALRRLFGGLLVTAGLLSILLGGLCTGWIVVPSTIEMWSTRGIRTLGDLWAVYFGGFATIAIGILLIRAGLRRMRGTASAGLETAGPGAGRDAEPDRG